MILGVVTVSSNRNNDVGNTNISRRPLHPAHGPRRGALVVVFLGLL